MIQVYFDSFVKFRFRDWHDHLVALHNSFACIDGSGLFDVIDWQANEFIEVIFELELFYLACD